MYEILHRIFQDQKTEVIFTFFGLWHWMYILVIFGTIAAVILYCKNKNSKVRLRAAEITISVALGLYILDFFLMPFAYGYISIDKLPFHMCTATCILCFMSRRVGFLGRFRTSFALLGLASNLIYIFYPGVIGWLHIHPLSYRAVQTLLFHGAMTAYGIFVLTFETPALPWKHCCKELVLLALLVAWALLGNNLYNGTAGEYDNFFNWMFVQQDPFGMFPLESSVYIMPFVIILTYFVADMLIYSAYHVIKKTTLRKEMPSQIR